MCNALSRLLFPSFFQTLVRRKLASENWVLSADHVLLASEVCVEPFTVASSTFYKTSELLLYIAFCEK